MKRIALVAVFFAVLLAAPASAATGPEGLVAEYNAAIEWWGEEPKWCATVEISESWVEGEFGHADPPTRFGDDCGIVIRPGLPPCQRTETMRHEVGHLRGLGHSTDPTSVMYGGFDGTQPLCDAEAAVIAAADLAAYESWLEREARRCRHKHRRRALCFSYVREIRIEVTRRQAQLATSR